MLHAARRAYVYWALIILGATLTYTAAPAGQVQAGPSPQVYVEQAIALYNKGECVKAIDLLKKAVAADARYVRAYSWLGFCYAKLGKPQDAVAAFDLVVALAPTSDDAKVARQWIAKLSVSAPKVAATPSPRATPVVQPQQPGPAYLVTMPPAAGVTEDNRVRQVQLFGETYRKALVERRNWWQGRRPLEREWRVVYNLQRRFARFRVSAGVEDGSPPEFMAIFSVRADGNTLFESRPKRAGDIPDAIELDVTGVLQLEMIVRGRDALHTRDLTVVWADPYVDTRPAAIQPLPGAPQVGPPAAPPASPPPVTPSPSGWLPGSAGRKAYAVAMYFFAQSLTTGIETSFPL